MAGHRHASGPGAGAHARVTHPGSGQRHCASVICIAPRPDCVGHRPRRGREPSRSRSEPRRAPRQPSPVTREARVLSAVRRVPPVVPVHPPETLVSRLPIGPTITNYAYDGDGRLLATCLDRPPHAPSRSTARDGVRRSARPDPCLAASTEPPTRMAGSHAGQIQAPPTSESDLRQSGDGDGMRCPVPVCIVQLQKQQPRGLTRRKKMVSRRGMASCLRWRYHAHATNRQVGRTDVCRE